MSKTVSFHVGSTYSRGHNIRDERYVSEQKHIDKSLSVRNEVIVDEPVREAYKRLFGDALREYNEQQSRADRRIENYYDKIKADKRKKPVYECIVQIGDKNDTGNLALTEKEVLREYAYTWKKRNPNLELIGAYLHADEPNGTVHLHCDFIPVTSCHRGMRLQNSFAKALEQQGHKGEKASKTAQMSWQESERAYLERLAKSYGVDVKANQGLTHRHLSVAEYQKEKDRLIGELEQKAGELREFLEVNADNIESMDKLSEIDAQTKSKGVFSKFRQVPEEEYQVLLKTAQNASALQSELSLKEKALEGFRGRCQEAESKLWRKERAVKEFVKQKAQELEEARKETEMFERELNSRVDFEHSVGLTDEQYFHWEQEQKQKAQAQTKPIDLTRRSRGLGL